MSKIQSFAYKTLRIPQSPSIKVTHMINLLDFWLVCGKKIWLIDCNWLEIIYGIIDSLTGLLGHVHLKKNRICEPHSVRKMYFESILPITSPSIFIKIIFHFKSSIRDVGNLWKLNVINWMPSDHVWSNNKKNSENPLNISTFGQTN